MAICWRTEINGVLITFGYNIIQSFPATFDGHRRYKKGNLDKNYQLHSVLQMNL